MSKKNKKKKFTTAGTLIEGNESEAQVNASHFEHKSVFDPNGSWTGSPIEPVVNPEQDVDDL